MNVVGVSAYFHDSSCCLLQDGKLVAAASEERFSRFKHDPRLPIQAFRYCLEEGGIDITDIDCLAYYEQPTKKLARQLTFPIFSNGDPNLSWLDARKPEREIRELLGVEAPIRFYEHHLSHAASSFYFSGFDEAAILTVDGVGEWATCTYALGSDDHIRVLDEVRFPHSVGLFYSAITAFLGFDVLDGEYKVMGLAPYGEPRFVPEMRQLIRLREDGQVELDLRFFDFRSMNAMYTSELEELLRATPRAPESPIEAVHKDLAKSAQVVLEETLLGQAEHLFTSTRQQRLCLAGGVALNCVANARLLRDGPFEEIFVQPAAGDAGSCLGAAALAHLDLTGRRHSRDRLDHVYLGPDYASDEIAYALQKLEVLAIDFRGKDTELVATVADHLARGCVVGWFQGRAEFGPRSLGARSILADPRAEHMRDHINRLVKKREGFRPFAPSILATRVGDHLDLDHRSPFMLETCRVTSNLSLPAITHVDGSCRPQTVDGQTNPRFAALLEAFESRTGCPFLLNTSFNVRGEPIVCSPLDALRCFGASGMDYLVLADFLIPQEALPESFARFASATMPRPWNDAFSREPLHAVYTFI
jgi:carbamoyltransferase